MSRRYAASPAAARSTTTRFIRLEPGAERPAQPGRAELQRPVEAVREVGRIASALDLGDELQEPGPGLVVGVVVGPGPRAVEQRRHVRSRHGRTLAP